MMRFFSRSLAAAALLAVATAVPVAASAQTGTLRQQVDSLHVAMMQAFKAQPASVAKFYVDMFVGTPQMRAPGSGR